MRTHCLLCALVVVAGCGDSSSGARGDAGQTADTDGTSDADTDGGASAQCPQDGTCEAACTVPDPDCGPTGDPGFATVCTSDGWCWENPLPHGSTYESLWSVSDSDVWAVDQAGIIDHWDGTSFSAVNADVIVELNDVWATASGDEVWVAGDKGTLLRRTGSGDFVSVETHIEANLNAIWGTGKDDIWIVGNARFEGETGTILHWDGTRLSNIINPVCTGDFYAVWASAEGELWFGGLLMRLVSRGSLCHFDGTTWTEEPEYATMVSAIWQAPQGGPVWVAGGDLYRIDENGTTVAFAG